MSVEEELKRKRVELLGEVEEFVLRIETIKKQVSAIDQVIAIYDPVHVQNATLRMGHRQSRQALPIPPELKRLNKTEAILEVLREAGEPWHGAFEHLPRSDFKRLAGYSLCTGSINGSQRQFRIRPF
ncbi:hypothetical protein [Microvirga zambiensis]|uniref:hypothetical protein n=1 Tax=Microvirga zambiensis TaxID=1402137 RepID=UPI00191E7559|nr:hypothetical protein [Microvirga zambiensis]